MSTKGLIGFRYNEKDKLSYNHSDSQPDALGISLLKELQIEYDWGVVKDRVDSLIPLPETRRLGKHTGMAEIEIRRHFADLEYKVQPQDVYQLFQPLQGTLKPYLEGNLMFMPDASDFISNSLHCDWAYIINLDDSLFEVWKGRQTKPDTDDNRYGYEADRMGYYPCSFLLGYHLDDPPESGRFLTDCTFYQDIG